MKPSTSFFCVMKTSGSSSVCLVRANDSLLVCWQRSAIAANGILMPQTCKLWPGPRPSFWRRGTYTKIHRRYACIKPLRNAMYQFAWETTLSEAWALEYYQRKRKEGKSHSVAVRALANVWVRVIYAMWHKSEPYQSAIFETAQQQHTRRAA